MKNDTNSWMFIIGFAVVGIIMLVSGIYQIKDTRNFLANSKKADGEVIGFETIIQSQGNKNTTLFSPKISFKDEKGNQIESNTGDFTSFPSLKNGEKVSVLYYPAYPQNIRINTFFLTWFSSFKYIFIGISSLIVSLVGIFYKLKKKDVKNNPIPLTAIQ